MPSVCSLQKYLIQPQKLALEPLSQLVAVSSRIYSRLWNLAELFLVVFPFLEGFNTSFKRDFLTTASRYFMASNSLFARGMSDTSLSPNKESLKISNMSSREGAISPQRKQEQPKTQEGSSNARAIS